MFSRFLSQGSARLVRKSVPRRKQGRSTCRPRANFTPARSIERLEPRDLLASLAGVAFEDHNANGVRDSGEGRLVGVTVYLDQNRNGALDPGEASTTTANDGSYAFSGLPAGGYTLREASPAGFEQTGPVVHDLYFATTRASSGAPRQLVRVDAETGQVSVVGSLAISRNLNGLVRTNDGSLFAIAADGTGSDAFYSVNSVTGAATIIGNTGMEAAFGLAYDPATDAIYGIGQVSAGARGLVTYNRTTGRATPFSTLSSAEPSSTNGIAFDPVHNRVLVYNFADGQIYGFNPVTGQRSTLARIAAGLGANLAFADGQLVMKRDFGNPINEFLSINPDTGQISSLFSASVGVVFESLEFVDLPQFAHTVTLGAQQNLGGLDFGNLRVNSPPDADGGGPYLLREGDGLTLNATASDPDGDALTFAWDLDGDGQFDDAAGATVALTWDELVALGLGDNGSYPISVRVGDGQFTVDASANVIVENVAPVITSARVSAASVGAARPGQRVSVSATFTDLGSRDTHTATIDWGDGVVSPATISGEAVSGSHEYRQGGVYRVSVLISDDDGGEDKQSVGAYVTGARVANGALQIVGTTRADTVSVAAHGRNRLEVRSSFLPRGSAAFHSAAISSIEVYLGGGNDKFAIDPRLRQPLLVVGGAGADKIAAGSGRSLLIGGTGADQLNGGSNQDLLIAGVTAFDNNPAALRAVLAEWSSSRSLQKRVANLFDGSGSPSRANGDHFLTVGEGGTVTGDAQSDVLNGGSSTDWLFFDPGRDRTRGRTRDDLFANDLEALIGRG